MSIIFNVLYWHENDENNKYIIRMFGKTENGKSVSVKVTGFIPYFYVEIPNFTKDNAYNSAIAPFLIYFQVLEDNKKIISEIKEEIKKAE